ncbi:DUF485 domain-containing protein [Lipingzhangella sp. LS1_29]|uniref:DUF485 domain-containing protein n=1 Tax=Lipingzhangella rawalii TaxID=2055835 RepID=A0ABU2H0C1_9ACTN|nr:DUF485 domain-containing protein [Lipingzhangella rawalii]MDS1268747.1 DUF485 domain-containing protein [Lipingzhangella rawalii]
MVEHVGYTTSEQAEPHRHADSWTAGQRWDARELSTLVVSHGLGTVRVHGDPRFVLLRRRFRTRMVLLLSGVLAWYLGYIGLTAFARDLLIIDVYGSVNIAMVLGLGQFASTFLLAWMFGRFASRTMDPIAAELRRELGSRNTPGTPGQVSR